MESLTGWGRTAPTLARVERPATVEQTARAVLAAGPRGAVARGLARSYGDAAQNAGGSVLDMTGLSRILGIDLAAGTVTAEAGVSLHQLMKVLLPLGWFVPVTPGTRYVTLGGAIGADIHGKNHHHSGSFCRQVGSFDLITADGTVRTVTRESDADLFHATTGGMGLTGVVTAATVRLLPVRTSLMSVDTERATDLDDLMVRLTATDHRYRYSVAWIDLLAKGRSLGRAVLTRGDHAELDQLSPAQRRDPLAFRPATLPAAPRFVPGGLLRPATVGLFNELWYRKAPRERRGEIQKLSTFFHPLDGVPGWNRVYGPQGFVQYQFVIGLDQEQTLRQIVERISRSQCPTFLAVLKRFGEGDPGWLSFPTEGWTLALDIPTGMSGLSELLNELDDKVAKAGGRIYLAKDSRLRPESMDDMYPRLRDFRRLRAELDPAGLFTSDLARRLSL